MQCTLFALHSVASYVLTRAKFLHRHGLAPVPRSKVGFVVEVTRALMRGTEGSQIALVVPIPFFPLNWKQHCQNNLEM